MTLSMEGFGPDSVFTTPAEDNGQYRISRSLVRSPEGSTVPLTRVKCLVSMTTPHDIRLNGSAVTPAFVEFDNSLEGFGLVCMNINNWVSACQFALFKSKFHELLAHPVYLSDCHGNLSLLGCLVLHYIHQFDQFTHYFLEGERISSSPSQFLVRSLITCFY